MNRFVRSSQKRSLGPWLRAWLLPLLALGLVVGPGLTVVVHACRIKGTEVTLERHAGCCPSELIEVKSGSHGWDWIESAPCCTDEAEQLGLDVDYLAGAQVSTDSDEPAYSKGLLEASRHLIEYRPLLCADRAPPPSGLLPTGRARLLAYSTLLI